LVSFTSKDLSGSEGLSKRRERGVSLVISSRDRKRRKRTNGGSVESVVERSRLTRVEDDGRSEIDELDLEVVRDDNVLVLDVAVADSDLTKSVNDFDDLSENVFRCRVVESAVLLNTSVMEAETVSISELAQMRIEARLLTRRDRKNFDVPSEPVSEEKAQEMSAVEVMRSMLEKR
jgi:hypothetical protein